MNKKITIYTLAEELEVSASTVSRAFNPTSRLSPEKRARILAAARKYGFSPNRAAARLSRQDIRIGVTIVNRIPAFYEAMYNGILTAERELAWQKVTADVRMLSPGNDIGERWTQVLNEFRETGCDGVILHGIYDQDAVFKINELVDAGIPVVTLHNDLPASKRLFNSTSNTRMIGEIAAELLSALIHRPRKNVVIFTGSMSSLIHQQLFLSFSSACPREGLTLLQNYDTMDMPAFAQRLVEEAFSTRDDIDGIYVSSANSIPICEYLEKHNLAGKVALVTSDTFEQLNAYIRSGVVSATIYQDPFRQGKNAFTNLYRHIVENAEIPHILQSNPQIVMRSNLSLFENKQQP